MTCERERGLVGTRRDKRLHSAGNPLIVGRRKHGHPLTRTARVNVDVLIIAVFMNGYVEAPIHS